MRQVLFWAGFALALPQAIWVRSRARRFADAKGKRSGLIDGPQPKHLLAVGDSIIAGVGCSTLERACVGRTASGLSRALDSGLSWRAIARTGATTVQITKHLLPELPDKPADFILVSAGVNDITALKRLDHWRASLTALIERLRAHSPSARIALLGIPPMHCFPRLPQPLRFLFGMRARAFDEAARRLLADLDGVVYVSFEGEFRRDQFAPDGYHPSEDSCAEIAEAITDALIDRRRT